MPQDSSAGGLFSFPLLLPLLYWGFSRGVEAFTNTDIFRRVVCRSPDAGDRLLLDCCYRMVQTVAAQLAFGDVWCGVLGWFLWQECCQA